MAGETDKVEHITSRRDSTISSGGSHKVSVTSGHITAASSAVVLAAGVEDLEH